MATTTEKQEFTFQAEVARLLQLLAHSLYQSKEIAIRELVSNASDALDKFRFLALTDESQRTDEPLEITLEADEENKRLTIGDNGIGMTRDEIVHNLGTIAHSGSLEFLNKLSDAADKKLSLIGQFGVGFYSAFMLADRVQVRSRSYSEESGWQWESEGAGSYSVEPAEGLLRGTSVILHLRDDAQELLKAHHLKGVLAKYSSFVPHPIELGEEVINTVKPIWVEPKSQLSDEQYAGFYQHLTHRGDEQPLWRLHQSADSPIQFHAILFCPPTNIEMLGMGRIEHGLSLCAKRILVQSDCRELLPDYLRFLYGLVDSEDLPLNISRETLQDNAVFRKIRDVLVRKALDTLQQMANDEPAEYLAFYRQFGRILREGVNADFAHRDKIAKLLRFVSSHDDDAEKLVSLDEYVARCPEDQKQIYYLGGPDLASIRKSPNLEIFRKRGLETLYLDDPIDEFMLAVLTEYDGRTIKSIDAADLELPGADEKSDEASKDESESAEEKPEVESPPGFDKVLELFRAALGDRVKEVRESKRLTDSPCCLVNPDEGFSGQMQKLMRMANKDFPLSQRILEINPEAPLIRKLSAQSSDSAREAFIKTCGLQLFANAVMLEGTVPDPQDVVERVQSFMEQAAG